MGALGSAVLSAFAMAALAPVLHRLAPRAAPWAAAAGSAALLAFFALRFEPAGVLESAPWAPALGLELAWRLDGLSLRLCLLVTGVGAAVLSYSGAYLEGDAGLGRFLGLILFFMASMLGLVLADNLLLLFVFWELTSISSYFLIGYYHAKDRAREAALQALLVTAAGGLALLAGFLMLAAAGGAPSISELETRASQIREHALYLPAAALILAGAFTKSAQAPFHFWLPNAMEAPAPVSCFLHAATMVKAGVYLAARLSPALGGTPAWEWTLLGVGGATMLMGAWRSLRETDLKRVLAHSTIAMLGALFLLLGLGTPAAAGAWGLLLVAHGLYKGALFLVAGAVEHETGERDARALSGLARRMPRTAAAAGLGALSMAGLPPTLGFAAKEAAFGASLDAGTAGSLALAAMIAAQAPLFAAALVVGVRPFFGPPGPEAHDGPPALWLGPLLLAGLGLAAVLFPALLWHGFTAALGLSALTALLGLACYALRERVRAAARGPFWSGRGAQPLYERGLAGLFSLGRAQTALIQNGDLRVYLGCVLLVAAAGAAAPLPAMRLSELPARPLDFSAVEAAVALITALSAAAAVAARTRLSAVAAMGGVGFGISLLFVLFGAPDLAMTQFVVEALTVILFVLVFARLPPTLSISSRGARALQLAGAGAAGLVMGALTWAAQGTRLFDPISASYAEQSVPAAHGRNVVNVILVDFRAFDTLGEIVVLAAAAAGVGALLAARRRAS